MRTVSAGEICSTEAKAEAKREGGARRQHWSTLPNTQARGRTSSQLGCGFLPRQKLLSVHVALRSIDSL